MQYDFIDKYNELVDTLAKMIRANKAELLGDEYSCGPWLPVWGNDIQQIHDQGDHLHVSGTMFTNQTGGSNEYWEFTVAKADIELFQIKQLLNVKW